MALLPLVWAVAACAQGQWQAFLGPSAAATALQAEPGAGPPVTWAVDSSNSVATVYRTTFQSAYASGSAINNQVPLWLAVPKSGHGPFQVVVLLHYLGAANLNAVTAIAHRLNAKGIAAAYIALPYHMERTPEGYKSGELAISAGIERLNAVAVQSVWDVRRAVSIVAQRPDVTLNGLGIGGVSLGSLIAELSYAIDPRFQHAAFLLGGADIAGILWHSAAVVPVRAKLERKGFSQNSLNFWLAGIEPASWLKLRAAADEAKTARPVLLVNAKYDLVMPPFASKSLSEALGNPYRISLDTGHYGGFFIEGKIDDQAVRYFAAMDAGKPYAPPKSLRAPTLRLMAQAMTSVGFDIGVGIDFVRSPSLHPAFGSFVATPRGVEIFIGKEITAGAAIGAVIGTRGAGVGVFWSVVL